MKAYIVVWEDEAKAREVELYVDYTASEEGVQVVAVRPTSITFYDIETKRPSRTIGVHTKTARRILTRDYLASRDNGLSLEVEIHNLLAQQDGQLAGEAA